MSAAASGAARLLKLVKGAGPSVGRALKYANANKLKTALGGLGVVGGAYTTGHLGKSLLEMGGVDVGGELGREALLAKIQAIPGLLEDLDMSSALLREEEIGRATSPFVGITGDPFDFSVPNAGRVSKEAEFATALQARQARLAQLSVPMNQDPTFEELALRMGV